MLDFLYSKLKFANTPKKALIPLSEIREGDLVHIVGQYNRIALFCVESVYIGTGNDGHMWEKDKGHNIGCGIDQITHIPADAQFIVYRRYVPAKKGAQS